MVVVVACGVVGVVLLVVGAEVVEEVVEVEAAVVATVVAITGGIVVGAAVPAELQAAKSRAIAPTMINRFIYCTHCNCFARLFR